MFYTIIKIVFVSQAACSSRENSFKKPSNDWAEYHKLLRSAKNIVIITGVALSEESLVEPQINTGVYRGMYNFDFLDRLKIYETYPSLAWDWINDRREHVFVREPNKAHFCISEYESYLRNENAGRTLTVITENKDKYHGDAGSENVLELGGSMFKTECVECHTIYTNIESPICRPLKFVRGLLNPKTKTPEKYLPHCRKPKCKGMTVPYTFWYPTNVPKSLHDQVEAAMDKCDLCLVVGVTTRSHLHPSEELINKMIYEKVPVVEFNSRPLHKPGVQFFFEGRLRVTILKAFEGFVKSCLEHVESTTAVDRREYITGPSRSFAESGETVELAQPLSQEKWPGNKMISHH